MTTTNADPAEDLFLAKLRLSPNDDDTRLVYADWLEERSRLAESSFLRFQAKLRTMDVNDKHFELVGVQLRSMASLLDPKWRVLVAYGPIERCDVRFDFQCPKQWEALEYSGDGGGGDNVRHCTTCKQNVYYSDTIEEASANARLGRCVVVDLVQVRRKGDLDGRPRFEREQIRMGGMMLEEEAPPKPPSLFGRLKKLFTR